MRPEKKTIVEDLQTRLNQSPFLIVTEYAGMNVVQFSELRNRLAGVGAQCKVVKNTFLRKAAAEVGYPDLGGALAGQTAIIIGERDISAAAKVIKTFTTEFKKPEVKAGVLDQAFLSKDQVKALADLPSREVLQAQLLGVLLAPLQRLVTVLNEPGASLARLLQAKLDQEGTPAQPEATAA